jgi:photosystem II stability/assembly factor-like uncharacterized protein
MESLLIGTRKGLFVMAPDAQGVWVVRGMHFAGEPVSQTFTDPVTGHWFAALRLGHFGVKLHKSMDRGASWQEVACPAFPTKPTTGFWADDPTPWNVEMIWSFAATGPADARRLWVGTMPAAVFYSDDDAKSWTLCESFWLDEKRKQWMGGGNDYPGLHTLLAHPHNDQHLIGAISCGGLWETRDGGGIWQSIGQGFKADFVPPELVSDPNIQDPHRVTICTEQPNVMWTQLHFGLYRSSDAGQHWQQLQGHPHVGDFGFPILAHPTNPLRAWVVPAQADALRYAPGARMCVARTDDGGASWQVFRTGLPQSHAYDLVYRHGLALASDAQTLAMASTTGNLWISSDAGERWQHVCGHLPPVACVAFESTG